MIRFHPSTEQLALFVEGQLSSSLSLMVSAHCDMCLQCQRIVELETESLARSILGEKKSHESVIDASHNDVMDSLIAHITQMPSVSEADIGIQVQSPPVPKGNTIDLDGRKFSLPRTLQRYVEKTGNWSSLVGKLWQAPVDLGSQNAANFIYMGSGGSVPEHTHRGTEFTLVIDGQFSDGLNNYDVGDFIFMDGSHTHSPRSNAEEGCLVFSILDQPLHFTSGLSRLLNPFSHLFFR